MAFTSVEGLLRAAAEMPLWQAVQNDDIRDRGSDAAESWGQMAHLWAAMTESVAQYSPLLRSSSDLVGGEGGLVAEQGGGLCGPFFSAVIATALKTGECNACMGRIVAAPTAGASGVMPAVLIPLQARDGYSDSEVTQALYVAAGFGQVIATRASIAGAEGGCQAEIGSASAMAAAALVHLRDGTPAQMATACATALQNLMGLVCDPVGGLVELPCIKRNVVGAVNAVSCANMALAGVDYAIPCDEVIDAMGRVGSLLSPDLRETGQGGLAATPTGVKIARQLAQEG